MAKATSKQVKNSTKKMWLVGLVAVALVSGAFSVLAVVLALVKGEPLYDWWSFLVFGVFLYVGVTALIVGGNCVMQLALGALAKFTKSE